MNNFVRNCGEREEKKMGVKQALKSLDAFPRAEEHLLQKTQSGAFGNFIFCVYLSVRILIVICDWRI